MIAKEKNVKSAPTFLIWRSYFYICFFFFLYFFFQKGSRSYQLNQAQSLLAPTAGGLYEQKRFWLVQLFPCVKHSRNEVPLSSGRFGNGRHVDQRLYRRGTMERFQGRPQFIRLRNNPCPIFLNFKRKYKLNYNIPSDNGREDRKRKTLFLESKKKLKEDSKGQMSFFQQLNAFSVMVRFQFHFFFYNGDTNLWWIIFIETRGEAKISRCQRVFGPVWSIYGVHQGWIPN